MSKKKVDEPIVNEEMLENAGAEPEEQTLGDAVEAELEEQQEAAADTDESNRIAELEAQLAQKDDRHLRLYAEFENYKKRNQREKLDLMDTAGRKTMLALLPVLDDLDRAAKQADSNEASKKMWGEGVGLIVKKLYSTLAAQGLQPMESTGEVFDADLFEAITEIPSPEMAGKVVDTVETGYTLRGKIIRHAKVVVGK